jgi:hypothetical protein
VAFKSINNIQKPLATTSKKNGLSKRILQHRATRGNRSRRIVALEEVAGSSPVGHPPVSCIGKANPKNRDTARCSLEALLTPPRWESHL